MIDKKALECAITEFLQDSDMFLVDMSVTTDNVIKIEVDSTESVSIDACIELSRKIEGRFDREVEDYELEVGSAGLTSPFKVKAQYDKNIGNEVEVLTADGRKLKGELKEVGDEAFTIVLVKKEKPAGSKRPIEVKEDVTLRYDEIKYTKYLIQFK